MVKLLTDKFLSAETQEADKSDMKEVTVKDILKEERLDKAHK